MKITKTFLIISFISLIIFLFSFGHIYAAESYTASEVVQHNSASDCWMIINKNVYNITDYLVTHDKEMDIRSWCGKDATDDYNTKNGRGKGHSGKAENILGQFLIGSLNSNQPSNPVGTLTPSTANNINTTAVKTSRYNVIFPFFGALIFYLLSLKLLQRQTHNFIWNSVMLLGLIPSFGFGMMMALRDQFVWLKNIMVVNILYYHVELSIVFGVICIFAFFIKTKNIFSSGKKY
jgi:cytochrome b involved in lipid metabolism